MGRTRRKDDVGGWFHIVNRGAARGDIFLHDRDRYEFARLLGEAHVRFGIEVHAYCLMSNHYHLLVHSPRGGLSDAMQLVGGVYARHLNERLGRDGPVFRGRYFARAVASPDYQVRLVRYIHRNPLAFLHVDRLEAYRWSSLRTYLGYRTRPDWLRTDVLLALVGGPTGMRSLTGTDARGRRSGLSNPADLAAAIDVIVDEVLGEAATQGVARTVMALLLDRLEPSASCEIASLLSFPSLGAERSARSRARRRAAAVPELRDVVSRVVDLVA